MRDISLIPLIVQVITCASHSLIGSIPFEKPVLRDLVMIPDFVVAQQYQRTILAVPFHVKMEQVNF